MRIPIDMPEGIAAKYDYKGDDGGNELLPDLSGHYWMNGYAIWRPKNIYKIGDSLRITDVKVKKYKDKWVWVIECKRSK